VMWLRRMMQHVGNEAEMNLEGGFQGIFQAFVPLGARLEVRKLRCPRIGRVGKTRTQKAVSTPKSATVRWVPDRIIESS